NAGFTFCVRVRHICEPGVSMSEWKEICLTLIDECATIQSPPDVSNITASSADVTWSPVQDAVGYVVVYTNLDAGVTSPPMHVTDPMAVLKNLLPNTNYSVCVRSDCGAGEESAEICAFFSTSDACDAISNIVVSN